MKMKNRTASMSFALLALFLALAPAASATNTWYVDGVNGNDSNDCKSSVTACKTIGHAISLCSSGDTIMVAPATYTENLSISISLKIIGSDAATTIVDGGGVNTVVYISNAKARVALSHLTIRNGYARYDGQVGGGVNNVGTVTIINSTISGNGAGQYGGGVYNGGTLTIYRSTISGNDAVAGGGICNYGTLTVNNSTISGNTSGADGGGIRNGGTLTISQSTISGNTNGFGDGSGIKNWGGATLTVSNSTITGNSAGPGAGINNEGSLMVNNSSISGNSAASTGWGSGINFLGGQASLQNTIVAKNYSGYSHVEENCLGSNITSNGYNLSGDNTCNLNGPGDMNNTDPKLGTLGNYGGPTQTIPLLYRSPAIDAGNPNGCTDGSGNLLKTDQRGAPRPDPEDIGGCDMGAFERQRD